MELFRQVEIDIAEITVQTRWILVVLVGASVLIPILQRVMEAILP